MNIPDIIGLTLVEAKEILHVHTIQISAVKVTSPPKSKTDEYEDFYRVIRVTAAEDEKVELLVCKPL